MSPLSTEALVFASSWELAGSGDRTLLSLLFGAVVGLSLGLTGGGGSIFAVPLLVYGLAVRPREAIGVSLAAVGATALVGCLRRLARGEVEVRTGLIFAVAGMLGAPAGSWLGGRVPEAVLLALVRRADGRWSPCGCGRRRRAGPRRPGAVRATLDPSPADERGPACRRDPSGRLRLTSRCFAVLVVAGLAAGVLSGLFGVGGGFVDRPGAGAVQRHGHPPGGGDLAAGHRPGQRLGRGVVPRRRAARCRWSDRPVRPRRGRRHGTGHAAGPPPGRPRPAEGLRRRRSSPSRPSSWPRPSPDRRRKPVMFFHQRFIPGLAIASYMVGDEKAKQVAVIDPTRDVDEYLDIAKRRGAADHAHPRDARPRRLRQRLGGAEGPPRRRAAGRRLRHGRQGVDAAVRRPWW